MFLQALALASLVLGLATPGLTIAIARAATTVNIAAHPPAAASTVISSDFLALAFEEASFVRYAQDDNGSVNQFSTNLMHSIYSRTGGKPIIRLGGTSSDYGKYLPGQAEAALPIAEQNNYQNIGDTTIGPSYWQLAQNFPNALYMVQVPLATTNISETIAWAQAAVKAIGLDQIFSIQPGNEADLYSNTFTGANGIPLHPPEYQGTLSNETYVGNWTKYVTAIQKAIPSLPAERFFTAFDTSAFFGGAIAEEAYVFDVETCFGLGIDANTTVKEVAHHYYQGNAGTAATLSSTLMNLTMTHAHLDLYKTSINWLRTNNPDIPFVLDEVGNSLDATNTYSYQAVLGSALWQVDYYLYCMVIGVARINWQQIMHSGFDMWLPVASAGLPAQVFSNYYSQPFLADFVGSSGKIRVSRLPIEESTNISGYVAWENGKPERIAIVNMNYWNATSSTSTRGSVAINFELPETSGSVTIYHLNSPAGAGAGASTITYGGSQWTFESLGKEVKNVKHDTQTVTVKRGVFSVAVASSSAVLIWL
ncbi:glycoside hydrolase family 79 protein [Xylariaceae sp. FL0255]|nr:glycoside hydrolase family 79 protein [Xylariaceae sp. FL0255]